MYWDSFNCLMPRICLACLPDHLEYSVNLALKEKHYFKHWNVTIVISDVITPKRKCCNMVRLGATRVEIGKWSFWGSYNFSCVVLRFGPFCWIFMYKMMRTQWWENSVLLFTFDSSPRKSNEYKWIDSECKYQEYARFLLLKN